jgi:hypothetical protein
MPSFANPWERGSALLVVQLDNEEGSMAVTIRTKDQALQKVAMHVGGYLKAMDGTEFYNMFGVEHEEPDDPDGKPVITPKPTEAENTRMEWAYQEVIRRLYAMGGSS